MPETKNLDQVPINGGISALQVSRFCSQRSCWYFGQFISYL